VSGLLELLAVMPAALVMCLVLTGVHGYLGLHVLRRKVIFVDLALAQIAALGGISAMALGFDPEHAEAGAHHTLRIFQMLGWQVQAPEATTMVYAFSLVFALGGAAVFATSRMRDERVPQEAFIGITFATAIAIALLLLVRVGGGAEQIRNMLARDALLLSTWTDVAKTASLYGAIALLHVVFRDRFLLISEDPEAARAKGMSLRWWDFLFYASFALVITESV
jgi:zinc/manganese transport system permease protein